MMEGGTEGHACGSPSSREAITVRCYLRPVVSLDGASLRTLQDLLRITGDLRRQTHHSSTRRIQRGSPGAGALGSTIAQFTPKVNDLACSVEEIATSHLSIPGVELMRLQFKVFRETLNKMFNDGGNEPGYYERVQFLEKLMYATGILRGHLEVVIEQHDYWKAKLAGTKPKSVARRLDFNKEADPAEPESQPLTALQNTAPQQHGPRQLVLTSPVPQQQEQSHDSEPTSEEKMSLQVDLPEFLQSGVAQLWETRKHTDVTFLLGNSRVTAHRAILASQSEYFDRLLFGEMREARPGAEIPLKDTPLEAFELLMRYAYSGSLEMKDVPMEDILEVVSLADRFTFTPLKEAIGVQLGDRISASNVLELMVHADYSHLPDLHEQCLQFIDQNAEAVLQSEAFLSLPAHNLQCVISRDTFLAPEVAIFQAVLRWKEHNSGTSGEGFSQVLRCIRLSEISQGEIFDVVEPSGLFDQSEILQAIRTQTKLTLKQFHPRGKRVANKNLFASPATTLMYHTLILPNHSGDMLDLLHPPAKAICEGYVRLGSDTLQPLGTGLFLSGMQFGQPHQLQRAPSQSSVVITLGDTPYLINDIQFQGYPEIAKCGGSNQPAIGIQTFSYTIGVSRDNQKWTQLANYAQFSCYSKQHLIFPVQAARYIRFELAGGATADQQFTICFSSCSFVQDQKPFATRKDGVIAPMTPISPPALLKRLTNGGHPECIVTFNQPYSMSTLSFCVCVSESSSVRLIDLLVAVRGNSHGDYEDVSTLENQRIGSRLTMKFEERVVSAVKMVIKEVKTPRVSRYQGQSTYSTAPTTSAGLGGTVLQNFLASLELHAKERVNPPPTTAASSPLPVLTTTTSVQGQSQLQGFTASSALFCQSALQADYLPSNRGQLALQAAVQPNTFSVSQQQAGQQALPRSTSAPIHPHATTVSPAPVYSIKGLIFQAGN